MKFRLWLITSVHKSIRNRNFIQNFFVSSSKHHISSIKIALSSSTASSSVVPNPCLPWSAFPAATFHPIQGGGKEIIGLSVLSICGSKSTLFSLSLPIFFHVPQSGPIIVHRAWSWKEQKKERRKKKPKPTQSPEPTPTKPTKWQETVHQFQHFYDPTRAQPLNGFRVTTTLVWTENFTSPVKPGKSGKSAYVTFSVVPSSEKMSGIFCFVISISFSALSPENNSPRRVRAGTAGSWPGHNAHNTPVDGSSFEGREDNSTRCAPGESLRKAKSRIYWN